ncbi:hypothetical protein HOV93_21700 [Planctomycetes bacterium FF15]|uniref:Uncharacterized protein n=1 Tax=Bremerella alba TaxID=980252 RepID=A0A7V9A760_9BACT|nr:hypothetical protein [Bremerella alba]
MPLVLVGNAVLVAITIVGSKRLDQAGDAIVIQVFQRLLRDIDFAESIRKMRQANQ